MNAWRYLPGRVGWMVVGSGKGCISAMRAMDGTQIMQSHGGSHITEWHSHFPEGVPQQHDNINCGIHVIANALATVLGENNSGQINPDQWRYWLAGEAIAKGVSDRTHTHDDIIPEAQRWPMCLWREAK